ncbi:transcriptional Coactivator p15-domain-containing protein [Xylariaceae sp. FL0594]|nr:transcriptional Coactivator p15-domain-containing protein [Xylariaceae sp. FL0594]
MARKHAAASSDDEGVKTKKVKVNAAVAESGKDSDGNNFFSLSATRRVVTQDFKGKTYVNIREYYNDASGELKPGKKGIMLTLEQYNAFLQLIPDINAELRSKGLDVADPNTTAAASTSKAPAKPAAAAKASTKDAKKNKKMNIEATSDEEED